MENIPEIADLVFKTNKLNKGGWLIVEHPKSIDFNSFEFFHSRRNYGKVNFSFFHYPEE
jgi:hypothetical protein